ncbi:hypothetical protein PVA44_02340 [Entomospira nematocerorum]|uniref:Uncharacterized protein n=1 Tax=Entomospira nematocerorum TaxID=2719987 RepID=A0A968GF84_9SPIO|nr:hypothetical protein [Entomospira nematocera]NIZ47128.1 hypothetical protein [Entomospira nematocera]WDI34328.1 hypothetical protein PVA44_02340 [Entomospira nematocera]
MVFTLERTMTGETNIKTLNKEEYFYQCAQQYQRGLRIGLPPQYVIPPIKSVSAMQPHDQLQSDGIDALQNISYSQEQLDFIHYHAIAIREALTPVITAFDTVPKDMGTIMNFCT